MRPLACVLLALGPILIGFRMAREERERLSSFLGVLELVCHIRYEISSFQTVQRDLFLQVESPRLSGCGFLSVLHSTASLGGEHILHTALLEGGHLLKLEKEDLRALTDYAAHLGDHRTEEETERAKKLERYLEERLVTLRSEVKNRTALYRSFGIVSGLIICLVVL